jgi:hypothetical protein
MIHSEQYLKKTKNKYRQMKQVALFCGILLLCSSCVAVKEYQKVNLNDPDMELTANKIEKFETNFQVYREGASGANGGKSGGGCGCN